MVHNYMLFFTVTMRLSLFLLNKHDDDDDDDDDESN